MQRGGLSLTHLKRSGRQFGRIPDQCKFTPFPKAWRNDLELVDTRLG